MKIIKLLLSGSIAGIIALLTSCYPGGPSYYSDMDVVTTMYEEDYDFTGTKKYFLADTVVEIRDPDREDEPAKGDLDDYFLEQIVVNLDAMDWERILDTAHMDQVDLVLLAEKLITKYTGTTWYPGGGWGWGGYYPGWGWGGGYYPGWGYPVSYSYTTGTLFLQMLDPKQPLIKSELPLQWTGILNGLLSGNTGDHKARIQAGVEQFFKQPPFSK